jgi:hypothetical protein
MPAPAKKDEKENKPVAAAKAFVASLPEAKRAKYADILADPELAEALGNSVMLQADYTRGRQSLTQREKEVNDVFTELQTKQTELTQWRERNVGKVDGILKENEKLKGETAAYKNRLARLADTYGISEADLKVEIAASGASPEAAAKTVADGTPVNLEHGATVGSQDQQSRQFVTREAFFKELDSAASLAAQFHDIQAQHAELFPGQKLSMTELLRGATEAANKAPDGKPVTLRSFYDEKYKVSDRQKAVAEEQRQAEIQKAREEGRAEAHAEYGAQGLSLGSSRVSGRPGSPLLEWRDKGVFKPGRKTEAGEPVSDNPDRGIDDAVKLFGTGEFREKQTAAA